MLSFRDFADYYDLSEEEIALLLRCMEQHAHAPDDVSSADVQPEGGDLRPPQSAYGYSARPG